MSSSTSWFAKAAAAAADKLKSAASAASNELQALNSGPAPPDASVLTYFVADCARRQTHFEQLRAMVEGAAPVFGSVVLEDESDLQSSCGTNNDGAARVQLWYSVALSIGRVLASTQQPVQGGGGSDAAPVDILLRCMCQLFAEVEHASGDTILPDSIIALGGLAASAVSAAAKASGSGGSSGQGGGSSSLGADLFPESVRLRPDEPIKPSLHTAKGGIVYEVLIAKAPCPFPLGSLDYREVAVSLLEALAAVFGRLRTAKGLDFPAIPPNLTDAFAKLDKRIMKQVVRPLCEDLSRAASYAMRRKLRAPDGTGYVPRGVGGLTSPTSDQEVSSSMQGHPLFIELSARSGRLLREATELAASSSHQSPPASTSFSATAKAGRKEEKPQQSSMLAASV